MLLVVVVADSFFGYCDSPISSGGPSWKETRRPLGGAGVGLKRSGFAVGRLDVLGGSARVVLNSYTKEVLMEGEPTIVS